MGKKKMVALLLAGGQGSRLKLLTKDIAKPAVAFGGKYRIIDFALSNATNSDISDIAILTQYKPFELNSHLGIGAPWDFDTNAGGLVKLSPFASESGGRWFTGTANAIYENIDSIDLMNPEYVLILSGDHIYKMNYKKMLNYHIENKSDCTIAAIEVPMDEASRFGILNTDENNMVYEFEEKPEHPKNNQASMGIYIFKWDKLKEYLIEDENDKTSANDFGKNIIPKMLKAGERLFAFNFKGYWKDVGTVRSYWESNLDLLDEDNNLDIFDRSWRIYTNNLNLPPQYIAPSAYVDQAMINEGCFVAGRVENSVLFSNVTIEEGAQVKNSVLLSNSVIKSGAKVYNAIIMEDVIIEKDRIVGSENDDLVHLLSQDEEISE
ncbi:glucose-1-phosphate adenylyltransferase [Neofamilia massiliensis]|uniref:glucose-1-phosphate adenylyltransferase n=1 Tax=Neofamilia massiliensis TaxID=1673724 RepID=UPI0006BB69A0|nr:glucose-1-phosphate adenylyltransferase [Neofamilia massiliensis]